MYQIDCGDCVNEKKTFLGAIQITEKLLNDFIFMCESRMKSTYFTREGRNKLGFKNLMLFCLNLVKMSIQLELDAFFKLLNEPGPSISKQGFSEARKKISPTAFIKLTDAVADWFYDDDSFKKFRGFRLSAVDGSIFELNNSQRLRDAYGYAEGKTVKMARAMASSIYDLQNKMIMVSKITRYDAAERDVAMDMIEELITKGLKNDLILFDRGYPSRKFIAYLYSKEINFLMRVSKSAMKEVLEAKGPDQIITIDIKGTEIPLRVIRFNLKSGVEEVLVTSLLDPSFSVQDFKLLYSKRWGIETKYDELKNRLQIQNFTGDTVISIEQDFYASVYLANMAALIENEANEKITEENKDKDLKYEYQANKNIIIGKLKNSMVQMLLEDQIERRIAILQKITQEILRCKVPIRPGRSYTRKKGLRANRNSLNQKRCL